MMIGRSYFLCFFFFKKKNQLRKTVTLLSARKWPCVSPLGSSCWEPWTSRESGSGKGAAPGSLTSSVSAAFFLEPSLSPCESHGVLCLRWVACVTHSQPAALSNCSSHFLSFLLSSLRSPAHSRSPSLSYWFCDSRNLRSFRWSRSSEARVSYELQSEETRYDAFKTDSAPVWIWELRSWSNSF